MKDYPPRKEARFQRENIIFHWLDAVERKWTILYPLSYNDICICERPPRVRRACGHICCVITKVTTEEPVSLSLRRLGAAREHESPDRTIIMPLIFAIHLICMSCNWGAWRMRFLDACKIAQQIKGKQNKTKKYENIIGGLYDLSVHVRRRCFW